MQVHRPLTDRPECQDQHCSWRIRRGRQSTRTYEDGGVCRSHMVTNPSARTLVHNDGGVCGRRRAVREDKRVGGYSKSHRDRLQGRKCLWSHMLTETTESAVTHADAQECKTSTRFAKKRAVREDGGVCGSLEEQGPPTRTAESAGQHADRPECQDQHSVCE